jgi:hypothetical protein
MPYSDHSSRDSAHNDSATQTLQVSHNEQMARDEGSESPGYSSCHPGLANGQGAPEDSQGYYIFSEIHPEHGPRPTGHVDSEGLDIHYSTPLDGLAAVQSPTPRTLTGSRNTRDGQSKLEVRVILASVGTIYNSTNFSSYIPSTKTGLLQSIVSHSLTQSAHCHRQVTRTSIPSPMARWWVFSHSFAEA